MDAAWPQKHLKIYNLTTTNATKMKLTTIMYLRKTFSMVGNWGVTHVVYVRRRKPKTFQNEPENQFFDLISGGF